MANENHEEVLLQAYDLSFGLADTLSRGLLGTQVEGIWHTSLVVFGQEYYYGYTVQRKRPAEFQEMFGRTANKVVEVGFTNRTRGDFETFLSSEYIQGRFRTSRYHVTSNNCNHFARVALHFLLSDEVFPEGLEGENHQMNFDAPVEDILSNMNRVTLSPTVSTAAFFFQGGTGVLTHLVDRIAGDLNNPRTRHQTEQTILNFLKGLVNRTRNAVGTVAESATVDTNSGIRKAFSNIRRISANRRDFRDIPYMFEPAEPSGTRTRRTRRTDRSRIDLAERNRSLAFLRNPSVLHQSLGIAQIEEQPPLNGEVLLFLNTVFAEDESKVLKKVKEVFLQEGYYTMERLKGVTERDLIDIGLNGTWAKKLSHMLNLHFMAGTNQQNQEI